MLNSMTLGDHGSFVTGKGPPASDVSRGGWRLDAWGTLASDALVKGSGRALVSMKLIL